MPTRFGNLPIAMALTGQGSTEFVKIPDHLTVINEMLWLDSHKGPNSLWADSMFSSGYLRNAVTPRAVWGCTAGGLASCG